MDSVELPRSGLDCVLMVHIVLLRIGTVILPVSEEKSGRKTYLSLRDCYALDALSAERVLFNTDVLGCVAYQLGFNLESWTTKREQGLLVCRMLVKNDRGT